MSKKLLLCGVAGLSLLAACSKNEQSVEVKKSVVTVEQNEVMVTSQQAEEFGQNFMSALELKQPEKIREIFFIESFFEKVVGDTPYTPDIKKGFIDGANRNKAGILHQFYNQVQNGALFQYLKVIKRDGKYKPLFRMSGEMGVNYHLFDLAVDSAGKVGAEDVFVYALGENLSETSQRMVLPIIHYAKKNILGRVLSDKPLFVTNYKDIMEVTKVLSSGNYNRGLQLYEKLPVELREQKYMLILGMQFAVQISEDKYLKLINRFLKLYPDSVTVYFQKLDYCFVKKDYSGALECLDKLDSAVEGDPYLDIFRANIYYEQNNLNKALGYSQSVVDNLPSLEEGYYTHIAILAEAKRYKELNSCFEAMYSKAGFIYDPEGVEVLADYCKTDYYIRWKEKLETYQ